VSGDEVSGVGIQKCKAVCIILVTLASTAGERGTHVFMTGSE
jgi:hypothetical protein